MYLFDGTIGENIGIASRELSLTEMREAAHIACIDETIQAFVPGRSPGIRDVCIDSCGAAAGMLLLLLGHAYWKRRFTRKNSGGNET